MLKRRKYKPWKYIITIPFMCYSALTIILFFGVILNSFKTNGDILTKGVWTLTENLSFDNYVNLLVEDKFGLYFLNSMIVLIGSLVFTVMIASLVSYGLKKFVFKGRKMLQSYFMLGLMLPITMSLVPLYLIMSQLQLTDTLAGLILVNVAFMALPIFIFCGFMDNIPDSLIEAARLDGAGHIRTFFTIVFPLLKPAIGAVSPFIMAKAWNDFLIPMLLVHDSKLYTIPLGVRRYVLGTSFDFSKVANVFAAVSISLIPVIILYMIFSKSVIKGIMQGSTKE